MFVSKKIPILAYLSVCDIIMVFWHGLLLITNFGPDLTDN